MHEVFERPPLFDLIDAKFHIAGKPVIFSWGDIIYNPQRITIPQQLWAHEAVHGKRQGNDIEGWWRRYIDDPQFRLAEEIPAHHAEYIYLWENARNRQDRRSALKKTARRLANPLYGKLITVAGARAELTLSRSRAA